MEGPGRTSLGLAGLGKRAKTAHRRAGVARTKTYLEPFKQGVFLQDPGCFLMNHEGDEVASFQERSRTFVNLLDLFSLFELLSTILYVYT